MKIFTLVVAALLGGCVAVPYHDAYQQPYQYQAAPPVQYMPPQQVVPVGCIPPYIPVWNGCALPMYGGYYGASYGASAYYGEPFLSFKFIFGGGGKKHHGGGRHHRGR